MDPLSDMLSLLRVRSYMSGGFDAGGDWSLHFDQHAGIKFYAIVSGECWLCVDGVPDPVRVQSGDCFLLPRGRAFRMASDMSLTPLGAVTFLSTAQNGRINLYNGGGQFFSVCGHFALAGDHADILLGMLPPIVHLYKEADRAMLRWCVDQMMRELREARPGNSLVIEHLAHMMLVQALRLHMAEGPEGGTGWLFALADKQVSVAIKRIHDDPARRWTVRSLAESAAMSRTAFSLKFKKMVGTSPMEYLTRWRMLLAANKLSNAGDSIAVIAASLGYESESAFSTAFKRVMGCSPRAYSRRRNSHPDRELPATNVARHA
ncbi:MAG TPA: AraC family transcriptional regulator [Candidatus Acidoferrales bacterium]|nr:AraC family transcriptional regulator [Candidatus Acidoferrales bacterium]